MQRRNFFGALAVAATSPLALSGRLGQGVVTLDFLCFETIRPTIVFRRGRCMLENFQRCYEGEMTMSARRL